MYLETLTDQFYPGFKILEVHLVQVAFKQVEIYLVLYATCLQLIHLHAFVLLSGDKQVTGDIKALEKGQALLNGNKILACSVQVVGAGIFLSGIVSAAMKKQVIPQVIFNCNI